MCIYTQSCILFSKLYFIDYTITVFLMFPPLLSSMQHPTLPQAISPPLFMSMGHAYKFFGYSYFLCCTLHPCGYSVTTYSYFLQSPHVITHSPTLPSHLATITMLSVSMILSLFLFAQFVFQRQLLMDMYFLPFIVYSFDLFLK